MKQQSLEWFEMKLGKFSASSIHKLMGVRGFGKTGESYILEKVTEELTGLWEEIFGAALDWGNKLEPYAKDHYCKVMNVNIHTPAWKKICKHSGVSPDGIIKGQKKGIEIKCPYNRINHTKNLLITTQEEFKSLRPEYYWQIQMQMMAYRFNVWDFVSYNPEFDGANKMFVFEVKRNEDDQLLLKQRLSEAITMKLDYLHKLK
jgi:putative phage-type endonuclease